MKMSTLPKDIRLDHDGLKRRKFIRNGSFSTSLIFGEEKVKWEKRKEDRLYYFEPISLSERYSWVVSLNDSLSSLSTVLAL